MLDKLIEQAALILVIVPGNGGNQQVIDSITNSLGNASGSSYGGSRSNHPQKVDAETVAVITAAASHIIGQAFQIKKIQFIKEQHDSSWSRMGKLDVFASHEIKRY